MNAVYNILSTTTHGAYLKLKSLDLLKDVIIQTKYLDNNYTTPTMPQRFWHIKNKIKKVILCDVCKTNPAKFNNSHGYVACSPECKNKKNQKATEKAVKKKYGVTNTLMIKSVRDKSIKTMKERYGVTNYSYAADFKEKTRITNLFRHGVESYPQTLEFKQNLLERYRKMLGKRLGKDYEILAYMIKRNEIELKHINCDSIFVMIGTTVYTRLSRNKVCPKCYPIDTSSFKEKDVLNYVRSIYSDPIIENDRLIIKPFEVDIFLPDLNLAIEFNGTYHHADARFYSNDGFVFHRTVKEIRNKDNRKLKACETAGIMLLVIWEYDWDNHVEDVMLLISEAINNAQDKVITPNMKSGRVRW